jgi:hypothetical protein
MLCSPTHCYFALLGPNIRLSAAVGIDSVKYLVVLPEPQVKNSITVHVSVARYSTKFSCQILA